MRIVDRDEFIEHLRAKILQDELTLEKWKANPRANLQGKYALEVIARLQKRRGEVAGLLREKESATLKRPKKPIGVRAEPKLHEQSYLQKDAAKLLGLKTDRQVRNLIKQGKLNKSRRGAVVNDEKFRALYDRAHRKI